MRGGFWPPALLCAALAFALAFVPLRIRLWSLVALVAAAAVTSRVSFPQGLHEVIFAGCWASVILAALTVHGRVRAALWPATLLATNAGVWSGAVTAIAGNNRDLLAALPVALLSFPAAWLVARGYSIAIKILASWLIAVAILVAALPIVSTPGYRQDHLE